MKQKSRINGMEYTFLESLPVLGENRSSSFVQIATAIVFSARRSYGVVVRVVKMRCFLLIPIVLHSKKSNYFFLCSKGEKMFMQGAIPASKQGKAAIRRCAKTNGSTVYVIKRNIGVQIVPIGSFCP